MATSPSRVAWDLCTWIVHIAVYIASAKEWRIDFDEVGKTLVEDQQPSVNRPVDQNHPSRSDCAGENYYGLALFELLPGRWP